jgi:hypothetical protein
MSVKFGAFVPQGWRMDLAGITDPAEKYETMTAVAVEAEKLGFDSVWVYDHFHTVPEPTLEATFEAWTVMAALASDTSKVKLGQLIEIFKRMIEAGVEYFALYFDQPAKMESMRLFASEVIPALQAV